MSALVKVGRLDAKRTFLLLCDLQEKFTKSIQYFNEIYETSDRLFEASKLLQIPVVVTEHYPKGLGQTMPALRTKVLETPEAKIFEKTLFSMCTPELLEHLKTTRPDYDSVILCGIEAHACVLATCLDLREAGKDVHVIVDAVSSRNMADRKLAFERMKQAGAYLTSAESVLFQLCRDAKHPQFKAIQKLIATPTPDSKVCDI